MPDVHQNLDALGVCSEYGQGIYDSCAVRIGGKLYCKTDADQVFGHLMKERQEAASVGVERPMRIIVSSVLFIICGIVGIGLSILFLLAGFAAGFASVVTGPFSGIAATSVGLLGFGGILLLMAILGIISGWWLWNGRNWGAVFGYPILVAGIVIATVLTGIFPSLPTQEIAGTVWIGNGIMMFLLSASWSKLK